MIRMPNELFITPRHLPQAVRGVSLTIVHPYLGRHDTMTVYLLAFVYDDLFERFLVAALPRNDKQR